jgi:surfeit locus 1 family protein
LIALQLHKKAEAARLDGGDPARPRRAMIVFRPMPRLTAATLAALALLVALGVWQLGRAEQKRALIAERAALDVAPPFDDLFTAVCRSQSDVIGRTVRPPEARLGEEVRFYGAGPGGQAGWRILRLTPAQDCDCAAAAAASACARSDLNIVVEVAFEALNGERSGPPRLLEIRRPPEPNAFTPQNDPERGEFYRFDPAAFARAFGVAPERVEGARWLAAHTPGLPPALTDMPPARHTGYAITWFGIAVTLVVIYFAYHRRAGRLSRER